MRVQLDVVPRSENLLDLDVLRLQMEVFTRDGIPPYIKMYFTNDDHKVYYHMLSVSVKGKFYLP
jgi:hypothetical protein